MRQINWLKTTFLKVQVCIKDEDLKTEYRCITRPFIRSWSVVDVKVMPSERLVRGRCLAQPGCQAALQHHCWATEMWERQGAGLGGEHASRGTVQLVMCSPDHPSSRSGSGHTHSDWMARLSATLSRRAVVGFSLHSSTSSKSQIPLEQQALGHRPNNILRVLVYALSSAPWEQPNIGPVRFRLARTQRPGRLEFLRRKRRGSTHWPVSLDIRKTPYKSQLPSPFLPSSSAGTSTFSRLSVWCCPFSLAHRSSPTQLWRRPLRVGHHVLDRLQFLLRGVNGGCFAITWRSSFTKILTGR